MQITFQATVLLHFHQSFYNKNHLYSHISLRYFSIALLSIFRLPMWLDRQVFLVFISHLSSVNFLFASQLFFFWGFCSCYLQEFFLMSYKTSISYLLSLKYIQLLVTFLFLFLMIYIVKSIFSF